MTPKLKMSDRKQTPARYKIVATSKQPVISAGLQFVGRIASPLGRLIDPKFEISVAASSGYTIVSDVNKSSRGSVGLQVAQREYSLAIRSTDVSHLDDHLPTTV